MSGKLVGYVGLVGLVWFVLEGSKSNTVTQSLKTVTQGRYRAARAAKKDDSFNFLAESNLAFEVTKEKDQGQE